jgi:hypothetical protein
MSVRRVARDERTCVLSALLRLLRGLRPRAGPPSDISENLPPKRKLFRLRRSDPLGPKVLAKPPCGPCNPQKKRRKRKRKKKLRFWFVRNVAGRVRPSATGVKAFFDIFSNFRKKNFPPRIVIRENFLFAESPLDNTFVKKKSGCYIVYDIRL